ncbi:hypothetical protein [Microtetraspora sp. NBRC 16547]|uniref:hypothetical protein n=1 Tax=Microtetraspora sp. NBRC 16547 TaxID=3030993 RepID=UPI0024A59BDA|nr:hypothetical protein [Microtetraspora sp. NBRC 16547]GLX03008.1 hypothetical protein Misp02_70940 [Microtetraspora sp. NBRC 16547]
MKIRLKRTSRVVSIAVAMAATGIVLGSGAASAQTVVKTYPYTSAGARSCQIDLKLAPAGYYCTTISNPTRYALAH